MIELILYALIPLGLPLRLVLKQFETGHPALWIKYFKIYVCFEFPVSFPRRWPVCINASDDVS